MKSMLNRIRQFFANHWRCPDCESPLKDGHCPNGCDDADREVITDENGDDFTVSH